MNAEQIHEITERYHRALEAKPSKGPISDIGIAAITDSVCDVPQLLAEVDRLAAEASNISHDYDGRGERLWRLAAEAGWTPGNEGDNDATAELVIRSLMEETDDRFKAERARAETAEALAERLATRIGNYSRSAQEQLDPLFQALGKLRALVSDWQANGNSRPLGDPTAATWQTAALQLLGALNGKDPDHA